MQVLDCHLGLWKACALIEEMAHDQLMAVIQVLDKDDHEVISSRHTVVFDNHRGGDALSQTRVLMQDLLAHRYGV